MNTLIDYMLKMFLVSGVLYGYYHLALRDNRFHQWNRFYLLGAVLLSVMLPLIHISVHRASQGENQLLFAVWDALNNHKGLAIASPQAAANSYSWLTLASIPALVYAALVLIQLLALAWRLGALRRLFLRSPHVHLESITLVETADKGAPYSFFSWIFWNRALDLNSNEGQHILKHELTHVRQRHSLDKMLLQVLCVVFFPIVFLHLIRKELQLIHEYLADKEATADGELADYARLLVSQAFEASPLAFANSFFQNPIKRRINMMTRFSNPRFTYLRKIAFLPLAVGLFGLLAFRVDAAHPIFRIQILNAEEHLQNIITVSDAGAAAPASISVEPLARTVVQNDAVAETDTVPSQPPPIQQVTVVGFSKDTAPSQPPPVQQINIIGFQKDTPGGRGNTGGRNEQVLVIGRPATMRDTAPTSSPMIVVDGKIHIGDNVLGTLNPNEIESISVLKGDSAIAKYGAAAVNGVVDIHLKSGVATVTTEANNVVFTKVEYEAAFPGGDQAWYKYIQQIISAHVAELNADNRSGTCEVAFIVNKDGSVTDAHAITMQGTKLASISVDAILKSPKWLPAHQNGQIVAAFRRQSITYSVPN